MRESAFWQYLKPKINGHPIRVESPVSPGMSDVLLFDKGRKTIWVELKYEDDWNTPALGVRPNQKQFMMDSMEAGCLAWACIRVQKEVLLFHPRHMEKVKRTRLEWLHKVTWVGDVGDFDKEVFNGILRGIL